MAFGLLLILLFALVIVVPALIWLFSFNPGADVLRAESRAARPDWENPRATPAQMMAEEVARLKREFQTAEVTIQHKEQRIRHLEVRVASLEAAAAQSSGLSSVSGDDQFRRLRSLILKELHPDHAPAGSVDRALRAEVFKSMWPKIEEIGQRG